MFTISYPLSAAVVALLWILVRTLRAAQKKPFSFAHEARLLPALFCLLLIDRFVYFSWPPSAGEAATLTFNASKILPLRLNLTPFVFRHYRYAGWQLNFFGNILLFFPVGVFWPYCFARLNRLWKTVLAGAFLSLLIELSQLALYERGTDIDDLIANTLGALLGAAFFFTVRWIRSRKRRWT